MTGERLPLSDALLKRALDELAGDPDSYQLTADVLRDAHGIRQERPLWWPFSLSPRMGIVLAVALLIVGLLASLAVYAQLTQRRIPPLLEASSIVIQQSNGQSGDAYAAIHSVFAPGSTTGLPLVSKLPANAIGLRWSPDGTHVVYFTRESFVGTKFGLKATVIRQTGVFVADPEGSNPVPVQISRQIDLYASHEWWAGARWAPPGGLFALIWNTSECTGAWCNPLTGFDIFDSHGVLVTTFATPDSVGPELGAWSPDASSIGWHTDDCPYGQCRRTGFNWRGATASASDSVSTLPLDPSGYVTWTLDNRLGFVTTIGEDQALDRIYSSKPDGTDEVAVAWPDAPSAPSWSPDGRRLAAIDHDRDWLLIHEITTGQDTVVQMPEEFGIAAWSPESDRIVLYGSPQEVESTYTGFYVVNVDGSGGLLRLGDGEDFGWMPASAQ